MNLQALKERLPGAVASWADARIEEMARGDARLAIASVYLRRAVRNLAARYGTRLQEAVGGMALFVADEEGNVDADTLTEDMTKMLKAMPRQEWNFSLLHGVVGEGRIEIDLPDNALTTLLLGEKKTLSVTGEELAGIMDAVREGGEP